MLISHYLRDPKIKCCRIYIFCGRRMIKKYSSNQNAHSEHFYWLSYLPINMCIYILLYSHPVRADRIRHQRVCVRYASRARMAGKHQQSDLPFWYCTTFTNCSMMFSHRWITINVVMLSLVIWSVRIHAFRGRGFGRRFAGRVRCSLSVLSG